MAASYPTSAKSFTTRSASQTIGSSHMNDVQDEINAIETALLSTGLAHHLIFVDATYDIGASGATRPRDLFLSRNATIGGTLDVTGVTTLAAALVGAATQNVFNTVSTTVNAFGAGTAITFGATTGYTNARHTLFINDTANANMTLGLTINQGANDNEILALKSSDVAHGITDDTETDTFGLTAKAVAASGGLRIAGYSSGTRGVMLRGFHTTDNTTKATNADAAIVIDGLLKSGTGAVALGADANVLVVRTAATAKFILDGDGDSHQDVGTAWTNFDTEDDIAVLDAVAVALAREGDPLREEFVRSFEQHRASLERVPGKPVVTFNPDGHHFVNMSRLAMWHHGAIRQVAYKQNQIVRALIASGVISQAQLEAA